MLLMYRSTSTSSNAVLVTNPTERTFTTRLTAGTFARVSYAGHRTKSLRIDGSGEDLVAFEVVGPDGSADGFMALIGHTSAILHNEVDK